jgi:cold shock protein
MPSLSGWLNPAQKEKLQTMTVGQETRKSGSIRKLKQGYGFIAADDGQNYFFHWTAMEATSKDFRDLVERERVDFIVIESDRGPRAIQVRVI